MGEFDDLEELREQHTISPNVGTRKKKTRDNKFLPGGMTKKKPWQRQLLRYKDHVARKKKRG